jgi:hypothetical protein
MACKPRSSLVTVDSKRDVPAALGDRSLHRKDLVIPRVQAAGGLGMAPRAMRIGGGLRKMAIGEVRRSERHDQRDEGDSYTGRANKIERASADRIDRFRGRGADDEERRRDKRRERPRVVHRCLREECHQHADRSRRGTPSRPPQRRGDRQGDESCEQPESNEAELTEQFQHQAVRLKHVHVCSALRDPFAGEAALSGAQDGLVRGHLGRNSPGVPSAVERQADEPGGAGIRRRRLVAGELEQRVAGGR